MRFFPLHLNPPAAGKFPPASKGRGCDNDLADDRRGDHNMTRAIKPSRTTIRFAVELGCTAGYVEGHDAPLSVLAFDKHLEEDAGWRDLGG